MSEPTALDDEVVEVTRRLIAAPSANPPGDERAVAAVICDLLADRRIGGIETVAATPERPNVLARIESGKPGPALLLCGHIDTKPAGELERWTHDPLGGGVSDGRLYGLGSCDMKGGVAAIVVALGRLRKPGALACGSVVAAFTADEEAGSGMGAKLLAETGHLQADAAILTEPAGIDRDWQGLYLGTRGSLLFRVDVEGTTGHSSLEDHFAGESATMAMARLMIEIDTAMRRLPGVAVNVGATVEGGIHYGVRAGTAAVRADVRFPPPLRSADVQAVLEDTVRQFLAVSGEQVRATVVLDELAYGPFEPLSAPAGSAVARACREAAADILGAQPPESIFPGGTDSFFIQGTAGIATMPAFGPGCLREAHQPDEYVSLASLCVAPRLLLSAAERFLAGGRVQ